MRAKLLQATREYFKDDLSAEAAIDIILEIMKDNGYRITTSHIDSAVAMAREMGKECIIVIGAEQHGSTVSSEVDNIALRNAEPYLYHRLSSEFETVYTPPAKHTHKRKSSREI